MLLSLHLKDAEYVSPPWWNLNGNTLSSMRLIRSKMKKVKSQKSSDS